MYGSPVTPTFSPNVRLVLRLCYLDLHLSAEQKVQAAKHADLHRELRIHIRANRPTHVVDARECLLKARRKLLLALVQSTIRTPHIRVHNALARRLRVEVVELAVQRVRDVRIRRLAAARRIKLLKVSAQRLLLPVCPRLQQIGLRWLEVAGRFDCSGLIVQVDADATATRRIPIGAITRHRNATAGNRCCRAGVDGRSLRIYLRSQRYHVTCTAALRSFFLPGL